MSDLDDIAAQALFAISKRSKKREHIGVIFEDEEGRLQIADPTRGEGSSSKARGAFTLPPGSLRALVHNHPKGRENEWFSPADLDQAQRLGVPSYIDVQGEGAGELRRYDPGEPSAHKLKLGGNYSQGEPVLSQFPLEELRNYLMRELLGRDPGDERGLMR